MSSLASNDPSAATIAPGSLRAWAVAIRPRSLPIAVSPVLVGAAFAWARTGTLDAALFAVAFSVSLLMQLITNLQNDVGYTARGGERLGNRVGLPRATAQGWLRPGQVRAAILGLVLLAVLLALPAILLRGWTVLLIGAASIGAALGYMGGPRPIAFTPFGEAVVFVFFGLVAVVGTDFTLSGGTSASTVLAATSLGALAAAVLVVNNHRDTAHDRSVGRRTFAVCFGARASLALYGVLLALPFALAPALALLQGHAALLLPWLLAPVAWRLWRDVRAAPPGLAFNALMFRTVKLELALAMVLVVAVVASVLASRLAGSAP